MFARILLGSLWGTGVVFELSQQPILVPMTSCLSGDKGTIYLKNTGNAPAYLDQVHFLNNSLNASTPDIEAVFGAETGVMFQRGLEKMEYHSKAILPGETVNLFDFQRNDTIYKVTNFDSFKEITRKKRIQIYPTYSRFFSGRPWAFRCFLKETGSDLFHSL